jgi:TatD DNase family protein
MRPERPRAAPPTGGAWCAERTLRTTSGFIDAHCHLGFYERPGSPLTVGQAIAAASAAGIDAFIQGGVDPEDWERQTRLSGRYPGSIWTSFGLHPWWVDACSDAALEAGLASLEARAALADAIGEIGIDRGPRGSGGGKAGRARQERAFREQLALARRHDRPLVLHVVRAHGRATEILAEAGRAAGPLPWSGLIHSFSGGEQEARKYLDLGILVSVGPGVLGGGFEKLKKALHCLPPDGLALESDSPDRLDGPASLLEVARAVGRIRGEDPGALLERSSANLRRVFRK